MIIYRYKPNNGGNNMKDFAVYEHIDGLCHYLDTINEEVTECVTENCRTAMEVEEYVENINKMQSTDKYGRKRYLYVHWFTD